MRFQNLLIHWFFLPKKIYCKKLKFINDTDLHVIEEEIFTYNINCFPVVTYPDIVNYLIFDTSLFSAEDMKVNKSFDSYSYVFEGSVNIAKMFVTKSDLNIVRKNVR